MGDFELTVRWLERAIVLDLKGDLTKLAEPLLLNGSWQQNLPAVSGFPLNVVVNFTGVPYINSSGMASIIRMIRMGVKQKRVYYAYGLNEHYRKLFRMVGLMDYLRMAPDEAAVLEELN